MQLVLEPGGDDADHALVEIGVVEAERGRRLLGLVPQRLGQLQRLLAHLALECLALAVDRVELLRQLGSARRVIGGQAGDAQRHVGQPAGCVQARADRIAEVQAVGRGLAPVRDLEQRRQPGRQRAGADAFQALRHQAPVVRIELDHVGHRAERDQRQQAVDAWLGLQVEGAARAQLGAQGQQHVEHDADAGY